MKIDHHFLTSLIPSNHPFDSINIENMKGFMANYLAMSQAFPYLQAGSQKDLFFNYMNDNKPIDKDLEITSVVGNFLSWDETGGLFITLRKKMAGISEILKTEKYFHSNNLQDDLYMIFGQNISPYYSETTKKYLNKLYEKLSDNDSIKRCATMVSFEVHANNMITSLWDSLANRYNFLIKNELKYFYNHVGGEDPAEQYHVKMTEEMIELIANNEEKRSLFIKYFTENYKFHTEWCEAIKNESIH
ncbi:hypothetical protein [Fluviispira sanaruensis]|uniref:Uncharacterized protein n=1 Tax=Fluviispira sanaruensis TaxID=2493639 RepID=A0A4P2VQI0_FLUSA|nr:hypothetical protein [Fluviispira sanaruensis]BBH54554.1 hypothetical protein JCM31447_30250 [Fluviispira sanaruensis]